MEWGASGASPMGGVMFLVRILVERLLALVFSLVGTAAVFQGLAVLIATVAVFALPGRSEWPSWLAAGLVQTGFLSAIFLACGFVLSGLTARAPKTSWRDVDESLPREWVWPAMIPTIGLPLFAVFQSERLYDLWRDIVPYLEKISPADFTRGPGGWVLLPILAILFVPALQALTALFLIALPPLLLVLLVTRSHSFRLDCQRLVVAQAALVTASLLGARLFAKFADLAIPPIRAEKGTEAALVVAALERGREVLWNTAIGHGVVALGFLMCLWVLLAARPARTDPSAAVLSSPHDGTALFGDSPGRDPR
jgi:hypothetical protein